jgi:hypothetical protein
MAARKIFGLHLTDDLAPGAQRLAEKALAGNRLIIRGTPDCQAQHVEKDGRVDLQAAIGGKQWVESIKAKVEKALGMPVVIEHWEYKMEQPGANQGKLRLLEDLLADERQVIVLSRVDPTHLVLSGNYPEHTERAWTRAFQSFVRERELEDRGEPMVFGAVMDQYEKQVLSSFEEGLDHEKGILTSRVREVFRVIRREGSPTARLQILGRQVAESLDFRRVTAEQVRDEIASVASNYYRNLWRGCSKEDQFVLCAVTTDGFVNATNPEVGHLIARGLIVRDPEFRLMTSTFKEFVVAECANPRYTQEWQTQEANEGKGGLKATFFTVIILVAVFLFMTQQIFDPITLATTVAAGLPILIESLFQVKREKHGRIPTS